MRLIDVNTQPDTSYGLSIGTGDETVEHEHTLIQVGSEHHYREDLKGYEVQAVMECSNRACKYQEVQGWDEEVHSDDLTIPRDGNGAHVR